MVLHSQIATRRPVAVRVTTRRRKRSKKPLVVGLLVVSIAVWWWWPDDEDNVGHDPAALAALNDNDSDADSADADRGATGASPTIVVPPRNDDGSDVERLRTQQANFLSRLNVGSEPIRLPDATANDVSAKNAADRAPSAGANNNANSASNTDNAGVPVFVTPGPGKAEATNDTNDTTTNDAANPSLAGADPPRAAPRASVPGAADAARGLTLHSTGDARAAIERGLAQLTAGQVISGRRTLSNVLTTGGTELSARDADAIRQRLARINESLIFSSQTLDNDPLVEAYTVKSGDLLGPIGRKYKVPYQLLERINSVQANRIRVGQTLKMIQGPFHAVVDKSDFRMDLFLAEPDGTLIYARSFRVGLGKDDGTPAGAWLCRAGGKLVNPSWTHPRTNQHYPADDPKNPIGEHWIALDGIDANTRGRSGYGIHGTIDPDSIGQEKSLGCVRMLPADVELIYYMLADGQSTVTVRE